MRTTLNLDDQLMQSIMKISGMKNKTEIIHQALSEFFGKLVRENIKNAYGKLNFQLDVREYRNRELGEVEHVSK
ncbi:MAG: type II toxin-antitoxin system VapB family antitoxin [Candidatus Aminicenantes bacterium]|nr:MAG: type II toxin-antitoxin system VapB family antitoxin [Candidatus Aminicenantes bacterium]